MKKNQILVYIIAFVIILLTIGLDQYTKRLASDWLASQRTGSFSHTFDLVVPSPSDGYTVYQFVEEEFGSKNSPEELARIASSITVKGEHVSPDSKVKTGEVLTVGWREITVIDGYWDYQYTRNNGAAFSFLADTDSPWRTPFFIGISLLSVVVILFLLKGVTWNQKLLLFGLALICGGAVGNLIDRILYGYVIDFIVWKYTDQYRWPTFNIADSAIVVGVALMILNMIFDPSDKKKEEIEDVEALPEQ